MLKKTLFLIIAAVATSGIYAMEKKDASITKKLPSPREEFVNFLFETETDPEVLKINLAAFSRLIEVQTARNIVAMFGICAMEKKDASITKKLPSPEEEFINFLFEMETDPKVRKIKLAAFDRFIVAQTKELEVSKEVVEKIFQEKK